MPRRADKTAVKDKVAGKRFPLNMRTTFEVRTQLEAAAKASGRSLAQEAEYRIERTFLDQRSLCEALDLAYGAEPAGLLLVMGEVMKDAGRSAGAFATGSLHGAETWWDNAYAFDQAAQAATKILDAAKPDGAPKPPTFSPLRIDGLPVLLGDHTASNLGKDTATGVLREILGEKSAPQHDRTRPERLKRGLGALVNRISEFIRREA
jgi:hypothetical protein